MNARTAVIIVFSLGVITASLAAVMFGANESPWAGLVLLLIALVLLFLGGFQLGKEESAEK